MLGVATGGIAGRNRELQAMQAVLHRAHHVPSAVILDGEAGIGKTSVWQATVDWATAAGFVALTATGAAAEVSLAWAGLAELLAGIDETVLARLPVLHQRALEAVSTGVAGPGGDERLVATAFRAALEELCRQQPVLLAVDDAQWLDEASKLVLGFAVRRVTGPVGVLAAYLSGVPGSRDQSWVGPRAPEALTRLTVGPMSLGALHTVVAARHGVTLPRPTMERIYTLSGGNPFFALELTRALNDNPGGDLTVLPPTLAGLVGERIGDLDPVTAQAAVTVATAAEPTVELIAAATGQHPTELVELLQPLESRGVVVFDGHRIRFTHPLIAAAITTGADPATRRRVHRRLADVVEQPELRARHLALSTPHGDPDTLAALDSAADTARAQGALATAAELVDLAIKLGGDTPARRIRAAEHHFRAGSSDSARRLLESTIDGLPRSPMRCLALMLLGAILGYGDDTVGAVRVLTQAADEAEEDSALRLHCLLRVVAAMVMIGRVDHAVDYAKSAVTLADRLDVPDLRSRALSIWVTVSFVYGMGVDHPALQTALQSEDPHGDATTWYQASAVHAMISAWTGDLHEARQKMSAVRRRMLNDGTEVDIIWAANHLATIDVWLGRYADAAHASRDAVERAEQMGGRHVLITAWGWRAAVAAYTGNDTEARADAGAAVSAAREIGAAYLVDAPLATLVFLEVSLGDYGAAMNWLEPLLARFDPNHHTELVSGGWLPDAVETLVNLGRLDEAEFLVKALHDNGVRMDRAWMLAMAGRGGALCRAARGDLAGAEKAAAEAMTCHDRLPMPFERARTQLLLGQLQRRRRRRRQASTTLEEALSTFEELGTPLWAQRTRAELGALSATACSRSGLTPAELRIAQRAAVGLSNKEIAAEQFLAVKTVEMTLSNVYRKLGIRSRTQLRPWLDGGDRNDILASP
jgi:DNA-binding CsgD family transcriptional regulator